MMTENVLFTLLRSVVCDDLIDDATKTACTPEMLESVYILAQKHDVAHLVGQAVSKLGLQDCDALKKCKQAAMRAMYRYVRLDYEFQQIRHALEEAQIPFIPLKGSVLRNYYPEPWMRTSCDIDILVHKDMLELAATVLVEKLGYQRGVKGAHDLSLFLANNAHLELHYSMMEDTQVVGSHTVLMDFWNMAKPVGTNHFEHCVPDEMFYFYHLAHMAKHVEVGGCGIRTFLDLWILNHRINYDRKKREILLSKGGLLTFDLAAQKLSENWFSGTAKDPLSRQFERFILDGGVYGTLKNSVALQQKRKGGKLKYALSKIVLPYETIKFHYPILEGYRWLTPCFELARWFKLLFTYRAKRSFYELQINAAVSPEEKENAACLLEYLGLD